MANGTTDFERALEEAERVADKYELTLPHVSDIIYSFIRLTKVFDRNIHALSKLFIQETRQNKELRETIEYMARFLTKSELHRVKRHMKKRRK